VRVFELEAWLWMSLLGGRAVLVVVRRYTLSMEGMRLRSVVGFVWAH